MYFIKGTVLINHKFDTPPEEYGVLTLQVKHEGSGQIEFIDIFKGNLISQAYDAKKGDAIQATIYNDEVIHLELTPTEDKCDPSWKEDVVLPGEMYDENDRPY